MENEPKEKKKKRFNYQTQRANSTHVVILVVVGAYLAYMGWHMIQNTRNGLSSMSMPVTILLAIVMWLITLAIFAYAAYVYYWSRKKAELSDEEVAELDEQMAQADRENFEEDHPYATQLEALYQAEDELLADEDGDDGDWDGDEEEEDDEEWDDDEDEDDEEAETEDDEDGDEDEDPKR